MHNYNLETICLHPHLHSGIPCPSSDPQPLLQIFFSKTRYTLFTALTSQHSQHLISTKTSRTSVFIYITYRVFRRNGLYASFQDSFIFRRKRFLNIFEHQNTSFSSTTMKQENFLNLIALNCIAEDLDASLNTE